MELDYLNCKAIKAIKHIGGLIVSLLIFASSFAQQPLYTQLGNNQTLNGVEIYGMSQDRLKNIWLTTSNGLYKYDGDEFENIKNESLITNEFFQPFFTPSNRFYFTDISGDIFTLKDDKITPFLQLSIRGLDLDGGMLVSGEYLYVKSKDSLFQIDSNGIKEAIFGYKSAFAGTRIKIQKERSEITIYTKNHAEEIYIKGNEVKISKNTKNPNYTAARLELHVITNHHNFHVESDAIRFSNLNHLGPYMVDKSGNRWKAFRNKKGVFLKRKNQEQENLIFEEYNINYIFEDVDDNLWIGTRNNGIFLVSDLEDFSFARSSEFHGISSDDHHVYAISHNRFHAFDKRTISQSSVYTRATSSNLYLFNSPGKEMYNFIQTNKHYVIYRGTEEIARHPSQTSLIKNHKWVDDSTLIVATVRGAYLLNPFTNTLLRRLGESQWRCLDVQWVYAKQKYLIASARGLKLLTKNGKFERDILLAGSPVSIENLFEVNDKIFGIGPSGIIYDIDVDHSTISEIDRVDISFLVMCRQVGDNIFILDKHNVYTYNVYTSTLGKLPILLPNDLTLSGITVSNDNIWLSTSKGLVKFDLENFSNQVHVPEIMVDMFEGHFLSKVQNNSRFKYNNNNLSFKVKVRDYKFQRYNRIQYQLVGAEPLFTETASSDLISYRALSPGHYTFRAKAINPLGAESETIEYKFSISHPWWLKWWFYVALAGVIAAIYAAVYYSSIKNRRERRRLKTRLRESQINAIMAQMNPHFIFNCLNSIQDLILQEDIKSSYTYLGKFSELTRTTMQDSQKSVISINRELNNIGLYLELEALRFKDLNYEIINTLSEEQCELFHIPPMLIQPFIENALKHGLLHSKQKKRLEVEIQYDKSDLIVQIKDNGVGREEATKIKKRQSKYRSFSGGAIAKRISLLNYQKEMKIKLKTVDHVNENKLGWSTIVEIRFINFTSY